MVTSTVTDTGVGTTVTSSEIEDGAVGSSALASKAVTGVKIADGAIGSSSIADGAVGTSALADVILVTSSNIQDGAVGSSALASPAVSGAKIFDAVVGTSALASRSVIAAKINDSAVGTSALAANAVTGAKVVDRAVGSSAITLSSVTITHFTDTAKEGTIQYVIDGGGTVITTGIKNDLDVPFNAVLYGYQSLVDGASGKIQVDIWKDVFANFPPTSADTMVGGNPVLLSAVTSKSDTTLSGWTTQITKGDVLRFNVDAISALTKCTISLRLRRS